MNMTVRPRHTRRTHKTKFYKNNKHRHAHNNNYFNKTFSDNNLYLF